MKPCDAHCHLANLEQLMPLRPLLKEAASCGITHYLSAALSKADLAEYPRIASIEGIKLLFSAGIHPFFDACDLELDDIRKLCEDGAIWAIGEIGLDKGNPDKRQMRQTFESQLELAAEYRLPVVLHIVGHQQEAYEMLCQYPLRYLLHGYAGSVEAFTNLCKTDCCYTISERILRQDKRELLDAMLAGGRYLFETDITRYYVREGERNPLLRLINVIRHCAELSGIDLRELIRVQAFNYKLLTGCDL